MIKQSGTNAHLVHVAIKVKVLVIGKALFTEITKI